MGQGISHDCVLSFVPNLSRGARIYAGRELNLFTPASTNLPYAAGQDVLLRPLKESGTVEKEKTHHAAEQVGCRVPDLVPDFSPRNTPALCRSILRQDNMYTSRE